MRYGDRQAATKTSPPHDLCDHDQVEAIELATQKIVVLEFRDLGPCRPSARNYNERPANLFVAQFLLARPNRTSWPAHTNAGQFTLQWRAAAQPYAARDPASIWASA